MHWLKHSWLATLLLFAAPARSADPGSAPRPEDYARKCEFHANNRWHGTQGRMLVGVHCAWTEQGCKDARDSVLAWASLDGVALAAGGTAALTLEGGHLVGAEVKGVVLHARSGTGQPVEVAICDSEPSPKDPRMVWYRIQAWDPVARNWKNPCRATSDTPNPRALAISGTWDDTGAHNEDQRKVTLACAGGAIAKCADWGYQPWANRNGRSLADVHQACTRMVRADYCGNGHSHTRDNVVIDFFDPFGVASRSDDRSLGWDPARAADEGAWSKDGATCLARTRNGDDLAAIMRECPGRFVASEVSLSGGGKCVVRREGTGAPVVLLQSRMQQ